ncbi:MAG: CoA-binding protein [Okeania sp. SIO2C2]|uniref:CoA-binding protein n=1 Tax=Okeania sp. SIO2C2 TaxID=2607787 RepID=UPI0013BC57D2|nr:CoA-binding protein [Okeania sp. SIO2C2]NEP89630.1 CoA-binding protein [Okeania sp. SIO2C2]
MVNLNTNDHLKREILTNSQVIAVVGHSDQPIRTSYQIAKFLREVGYKVYPVNPVVKEIDGQPSYAALTDIPEPVDIVNVFRRSEYLPEIVDSAIAIHAKTIWTQLDVKDWQSANKALDAGLNLAMDVCIKVEYLRLLG